MPLIKKLGWELAAGWTYKEWKDWKECMVFSEWLLHVLPYVSSKELDRMDVSKF